MYCSPFHKGNVKGTISKGGNYVIVFARPVTEPTHSGNKFLPILEGNNMFLLEKILSSPSRPIMRGMYHPVKQTESNKKLFLFCKNGGKIEIYPYTL